MLELNIVYDWMMAIYGYC